MIDQKRKKERRKKEEEEKTARRVNKPTIRMKRVPNQNIINKLELELVSRTFLY